MFFQVAHPEAVESCLAEQMPKHLVALIQRIMADVGHHGPHDVIISLDRALERGVIKRGSQIVLAAVGIGFTYAAALIHWGPS
ncbi:MAG: hypothetical protein HY882_08585 [Deltaproteobacteria bacterium]|nr:hypothetical protein [Deltaproteobacteria bacterium]